MPDRSCNPRAFDCCSCTGGIFELWLGWGIRTKGVKSFQRITRGLSFNIKVCQGKEFILFRANSSAEKVCEVLIFKRGLNLPFAKILTFKSFGTAFQHNFGPEGQEFETNQSLKVQMGLPGEFSTF